MKLRLILSLCLVLTLTGCDKLRDVAQIITPPPTTVSSFQMSQVAEDMVTDAEVSSSSIEGHRYYDKHYQTATFAGKGSGATIAIGVDLGFNSSEWTTTSWSPYYSLSIVSRLAACSGHTSVSLAKEDVKNLQDIIIVWNTALKEFDTYEVPNYYSTALRVFPGLDQLSINAQSGVVATAYNRGYSMIGASRSDMRSLRAAVAKKDYQGMADACVHMTVTMASSWKAEGTYAGLVARYKETAKLILTPDS